jgi:hypothetical protein
MFRGGAAMNFHSDGTGDFAADVHDEGTGDELRMMWYGTSDRERRNVVLSTIAKDSPTIAHPGPTQFRFTFKFDKNVLPQLNYVWWDPANGCH